MENPPTDCFEGLLGHRRLRRAIAAERDRLYRIAWAWTHDTSLADDLVQETLTLALSRLAQLREPDRLAVWLSRILANRFKDHLRARRATEPVDERLADPAETPDLLAERSLLVQRTRAAVARLGLDHRQVVTLVDLAGFSYIEVAQVLELPVGTVMSRLARARVRLRERLAAPDSMSAPVVSITRRERR